MAPTRGWPKKASRQAQLDWLPATEQYPTKNRPALQGGFEHFLSAKDLSRLEVSLHNPSRGLHVTMHADTPSHFIA